MTAVAPTIWIYGLSQSGKSTLADGMAHWLREQNTPTQILDGRDVRDNVGGHHGYSREERIKVGRIMASMASLLNQNGVAVIATAITPYQESRSLNRATIDNYVEIYLRCPVETCIERDQSDNYQRALRGDLRNFIGVDDPFEVPMEPDVTIDSAELDADDCLKTALASLESLLVS